MDEKLDQKTMNAAPTGSLRDNKGKIPLSWVPLLVNKAIATVLFKNSTEGGGKYPRHNWQKGNFHSVPIDCLMRHLEKLQAGEKNDQDDGLPHSWKILTNAMFLVFYEMFYPQLDDLPVLPKKDIK